MFKLYNTLSGKKETFRSLETGKVKMYTCGPTVYDYAHIGNFTAFIFADTLRRQFEYSGYEVRQIMNITDVGHLTADDVNQADTGQDKMLKAALREKKTPREIANFYAERFFEDIEKLNIEKARYYPRATAHIPQMIKIIESLLKKGLAYEKNGSVFFDIERFDGYGKLSKKKPADLKAGARLEEHPDKKHSYDFALWLKAPKQHLLKWDSPWSKGYPGWHIECSAMAMEYLGETLDIHTGGEDHIFPHHENEIAQSEGATGQPFAHFWFHNRFLLVDGKKMSKSKGNFYILKDITDKGYTLMEFRLLILSSHYRSNTNFTWDAMKQAKANFKKISRFVETLEDLAGSTLDKASGKKNTRSSRYLNKYLEKFEKAMNDDLNTPLALSVLYELISKANKDISNNGLDSEKANSLLIFWEKINKILGLKIGTKKKKGIPKDISLLLNKRDLARKEKRYEDADKIRQKIEGKGFIVEDSASGQKLRKK